TAAGRGGNDAGSSGDLGIEPNLSRLPGRAGPGGGETLPCLVALSGVCHEFPGPLCGGPQAHSGPDRRLGNLSSATSSGPHGCVERCRIGSAGGSGEPACSPRGVRRWRVDGCRWDNCGKERFARPQTYISKILRNECKESGE